MSKTDFCRGKVSLFSKLCLFLHKDSGKVLLTASVDETTKNIAVNFTGKKTTEDSTVAIKVKATVGEGDDAEEIEGTVTVKIKKYRTE
ncbi:hypothetical protein [Phocaeicola sp.]